MSDIFTQYSEILIRALGHSLWQAAFISGIVWIMLRSLPAKRAELRCSIALWGLGTIVIATFATCSVLGLKSAEPTMKASLISRGVNSTEAVQSDFDGAPGPVQGLASGSFPRTSNAAPEGVRGQTIARWLAGLWLVGSSVMLLRGLAGFIFVRRWLVESTAFTEFSLMELHRLVKELSDRLKLRRVVSLAICEHIDTPAVVGVVWPVIMVPVSMMTGVPTDQWRIIIAHELAHIRRWDPLIGLVQMVIESLLFFNPSVWWLSKKIRLEREACCDAIAAHVCGQPVSVARTLVEVAAAILRPVPAPAMAFSEPSQEGDLSDRVRRLVDPHRAPRLKISWISVMLIIVALATTLVLLQRGTDLAVHAAGNWLSPKERVDRLVVLEAERNGNFVPVKATDSSESQDNSNAPNTGKIAVHLTVKTDDGSKITRQLQLHSSSVTRNSSYLGSLDGPSSNEQEYQKTFYFKPSSLQIAAALPGFAAVASPVISLMPGDNEKSIELVLTKGSTKEVIVVNEQGTPIPYAWVRCLAEFGVRGSSRVNTHQDQQADEAGRVRIHNIADCDYSLDIMAPGYQRMNRRKVFQRTGSPNADAPFEIAMKAAQTTPIRVLDKLNDQPIENTRLRITFRQKGSESWQLSSDLNELNRWQDYAMTDKLGVALLDQLEENSVYRFAVLADGYGVSQLEAQAGQPERTIRLSRAIRVSGRITGDLERMKASTNVSKPGYQVSIESHIGSGSESMKDRFYMNVDPEGHFELDRRTIGERLTFKIPDKELEWTVDDRMEELLLVIEPASKPPMREVIIQVVGTDPEAPAQGALMVDWDHPTVRRDEFAKAEFPLAENVVQLQVPVGAILGFHSEKIIGYRIEEQRSIDILPGTTPQVIEAKATATGGIYGSIRRADGSPATNAHVTVFATQLPSGEKGYRRLNASSSFGSAQFMKPVPLGGRYRILVREQSDDAYAWTVSEEVEIDESNSIAKLDAQLPLGRDIKLRLTDELGKPVVAEVAELSFSFTQSPGGFFGRMLSSQTGQLSFSVNAQSDKDGVCTFRGISLDEPTKSLDLKITAKIQPGSYRGMTRTIEPKETKKPVEMELKRGLTSVGYVVDVATNKPIRNVELRVVPRHLDQAEFQGSANTKSDSTGRFQFDGLEAIEYLIYLNDASPRGTRIEPSANGSYRTTYEPGFQQPSFWASEQPSEPIRLEVIIHPNSKLRPLD